MGSCLCKEKTSRRRDNASVRGRGRSSVDEFDQTDSVRSDHGSSTSSGYHGSQAIVSKSSSKRLARGIAGLVLETLSVIRTLIDKYVYLYSLFYPLIIFSTCFVEVVINN